MIMTFQHKGLKRLFELGDRSKVLQEGVDKIERILARLEEAEDVHDMALPGFRFHQMKGNREGFWSVAVTGNWRIIFRFENGHAFEVDLIDYH